jgi:hypothetical protein
VVTVLRYLVQVLGDDARDIIDVLVEGADDRAVGEEYVTLYESILQEGMQKGLEQGLEQGLERGLEQGRGDALRAIVLKQVTLKLGPLSGAMRARIAAASADELEAAATRVLTATSADELFD